MNKVTLDKPLRAKRITLRTLNPSDIDPVYLSWLNDPQINRFLDVRRAIPSLIEQQEYVRSINATGIRAILGIFLNDSRLIGSLSLTTYAAECVEIGIMIGDVDAHEKGFGRESVLLILEWCQEKGFKEVLAKHIKGNEASSALFQSCGFEVLTKEIFSKNEFGEEIVAYRFLLDKREDQ